jgi:hypothetical protein
MRVPAAMTLLWVLGCEAANPALRLGREGDSTPDLDAALGGGREGGSDSADAVTGGRPGAPVDARTGTADVDSPALDASLRLDGDGDGLSDANDNCPTVFNPDQRDADDDTLGDACDLGDTDGDRLPDRVDPCPGVVGESPDADADGAADACDVCPGLADPEQRDADRDGIGDLCEVPNDDDADGTPDARDNCPRTPNQDQRDADRDGLGDACDLCAASPEPELNDTDADGLGDRCDVCPQAARTGDDHQDTDGDGEPVCAGDCDDADPTRTAAGLERCDGIDNDCDDVVDESFPTLSAGCEVGLGVCLRAGLVVCGVAGDAVCDAAPSEPRAETCDGTDEDCDGVVDEALARCCDAGTVEACGTEAGECGRGERTCGEDRVWGACDGVGPVEEVCNGLDDDCDGLTDEALGFVDCGLGACRRAQPACVGGQVPECSPFEGTSPELCNGVDDDCDGHIDEDEAPLPDDVATPFRVAVNAAIDAGLEALRTSARQFGTGQLTGDARETFLGLLAFLERRVRLDGQGPPGGFAALSADDQALVVRAVAHLIGQSPELRQPEQGASAYGTGGSLMALSLYLRTGGPDDVGAAVGVGAALANGTASLLRVQGMGNQAWSYNAPGRDLSTTHFASNGLAAADALVDDAALTLRRLPEFLQGNTNRDGGLSYSPGGRASHSMSAAGVWVYRLAGQPAGDARVQAALSWLRANYAPGALPDGAEWRGTSDYYHLWTLTKALRASADDGVVGGVYVDDFGDTDPAEVGYPEAPRSVGFDVALTLLRWQDANGLWGTGHANSPRGWSQGSSHAFALLTLENALGGVVPGPCRSFP